MDGKKSGSGIGMNIPDLFSEKHFYFLVLKFFDADPDPGSGNF
jgi:hypothetical protein